VLVLVGAAGAAVVGEAAYPLGQLGVGGDHRAGVAEGAQVLAGIEAEARGHAERAGPPVVPLATVRLGGVLDQRNARPRGDGGQAVHVGHVAVELDHDDRAGARGDGRGQDLGGDQEGVRVDVDEGRNGADPDHRGGGSDERVGGHDHLVAGPDAERLQGELQGVGAVGDTDRMGGVAVTGETGLELGDGRAADVPALQEGLDVGVLDVRPDLARHGAEVGERHFGGRLHGGSSLTWRRAEVTVRIRR
jgi:hypothetical protein